MKTLRDALQMAGVYWNHIKLSPGDAALGRIAQRLKELEHGGLYNLFEHTFGIVPGEELLKTYTCYISTGYGPVIGTLYISSKRLAFCSYHPLLIELKSKGIEDVYDKIVARLDDLSILSPSPETKTPSEKYIWVFIQGGSNFKFEGFTAFEEALSTLTNAMDDLQRERLFNPFESDSGF